MRTIITFLTILCSLASAQTEKPKPRYSIESKREGISIGTFTIELFPLIAPKHVAYFDSLVAIKFYDSLAFHRVVPGFVIQGGDPNSRNKPRETWGNGDPSQTNIPAEFTNAAYYRGTLGAARDTDPNSANSQFFICVANAFSLNGQYTLYGKVLTGMNFVDTIVAAPRDANDNPLKKIEMFVTKIGTNDSVPDVPTMILPANNAVRISPDSNLIWSAVSGAVLYHLELAEDSNFTTKIFSGEIGFSAYKLSNIQLGLKKYYWRVNANNGGHRSAYTPIRSFTSAVSVPVLLFPPKDTINQPVNVKLGWSKVSGAVSYHLQVATNATFSQTALVLNQKGISDTTWQMSGLQGSKKYYWRVAAETPEYEGAFAFQWNFTTGAATAVEDIRSAPTDFALHQNFPNPFNPVTLIRYSLPESRHVTMSVYDVLGKEVMTLINTTQEAGHHTIFLDASNLVSGIYFYRLRAGEFVETKRLMLVK